MFPFSFLWEVELYLKGYWHGDVKGNHIGH